MLDESDTDEVEYAGENSPRKLNHVETRSESVERQFTLNIFTFLLLPGL